MSSLSPDSPYKLRILETPEEMAAVEDLQRLVWPGNETDVIPVHLLVTAVHNGGLVIGAFFTALRTSGVDDDSDESKENRAAEELVGFVFGFPGLYFTADGPRPKHCSHAAGVHPEHRDQGLGYLLKRAQWQIVRKQGLDRITWTYDPLLSRNANLNISRLGAVCNSYIREAYGQMRDGLNIGLPSDRFQVDWWINSQRVNQRLSKRARRGLELSQYLDAGIPILNPASFDINNLPHPTPVDRMPIIEYHPSIVLLEIPADFMAMKAANPALALEWRLHSRELFETLFTNGYLVTDFVYLPSTSGDAPGRSFYVMSYGESTL